MVRGIVKARTTYGFRKAVRLLWRELQIQRRHFASVRRAREFLAGSGLKLHLGCGTNLKPGWLNVDLFEKADLQLDLREPLPFSTQSVAMIYSEHFFEHLEYPGDARTFLSECRRVLVPGGTLSLVVPDAEWAVTCYGTGDDEYFRMERSRGLNPVWTETRMHILNYLFRQYGEHKYAYDFETLTQVLADAGYVSIVRRGFDPDLDSEDKRVGSLYVDATRPNPVGSFCGVAEGRVLR